MTTLREAVIIDISRGIFRNDETGKIADVVLAHLEERHSPYRCHVEHELQSAEGEHLYDPSCLFCVRPVMDPDSGAWSFVGLVCPREGLHHHQVGSGISIQFQPGHAMSDVPEAYRDAG
jgi:hypothetical protein